MKFESHGAESADIFFREVSLIYGEVYAEPPYLEGPTEVTQFGESWNKYTKQPEFRLALALEDRQLIGFALGHQLPVGTDWWDGLVDRVPEDVTAEYSGRTFAIIEIAVRGLWRRRGLGRHLHQLLLANRPEERVILLSRPEAEPAQAAYASWGYHHIARVRPVANAPIYWIMRRSLPL